MTRDRIKEISEKAAIRVAGNSIGTRPATKYGARLVEMKKRKDEQKDAPKEQLSGFTL